MFSLALADAAQWQKSDFRVKLYDCAAKDLESVLNLPEKVKAEIVIKYKYGAFVIYQKSHWGGNGDFSFCCAMTVQQRISNILIMENIFYSSIIDGTIKSLLYVSL